MIESQYKDIECDLPSSCYLEVGLPYPFASAPTLAPDHAQTIGNELRRAPALVGEPERSGGTTLFNIRQHLTNFEDQKIQICREMLSEGLSGIIKENRQNTEPCKSGGFQYIKRAVNYFLCGIQLGNDVSQPGYICGSCGHFEPLIKSCNLRVCPECDIKRVNRLKKLYEPLLSKYHHPRTPYRQRFMTLTVKNMKNFTAQNHADLRKALRRFLRYKETQKYLFKAVSAFEVTYHAEGEIRWDKRKGKPVQIGEYTKENAGWHPHIHIIYYGKYFPNKPEEGRLLTKLWQKACKGLFETQITDVRPIKGESVRSALNELLQYVGKGSTLKDPGKALEYMRLMENKKLVSKWGYEEKVGRAPRMVCPFCEATDWIFCKGLSTDEILARRQQELQKLPHYIRRSEVS